MGIDYNNLQDTDVTGDAKRKGIKTLVLRVWMKLKGEKKASEGNTPKVSKRRSKKSLPIQATCHNCNAELVGRYCHQCGQDLFVGTRRSVWDISFGFLDSMYSLDSKVFVTLKTLLFYPGKLSKEFIAGRVVSYVHPSKLFWFISIMFFALFTYYSSHNMDSKLSSKESIIHIEGGKVSLFEDADKNTDSLLYKTRTLTDEKTNVTREYLDITGQKELVEEKLFGTTSSKHSSSIKNRLRGISKKEFFSELLSYAPYAMFLLIPFFALLMLISFRKRKVGYTGHLVFALHIHTFIYLCFSLLLVGRLLFPSINLGQLFLILVLLYGIIAIYNFYHPRLITLIPKMLGVGMLYLFVLVATLAGLVLLALYLISGVSIFELAK